MSSLRRFQPYFAALGRCLGRAVWLAFVLEWLSRGTPGAPLGWMALHPGAFALTTLALAGVLLLLQALTGGVCLPFWLLAAAGVPTAFVSGILLRTLGRPLLPADLVMLREALRVAQGGAYISWAAVGALAAFGVGSYLLVHRWDRPHPGDAPHRTVLAAVAAGVLAITLGAGEFAVAHRSGAPLDPVASIRTDGLLLTELQELRAQLTPTAVAATPAPLPAEPTPAPEPPAKVKPNIILILSESFWDPTRLPGARFESDPIPFFHELQQSYPHGWLLSPEFGGSTANVELEVLTGLSRQFFPPASIAYMQSIRQPVDSLASILTRQGYAATAISPWPHWFFNSENTYRRLGFGKFIPLEFYFPLKSGDYIADSETAQMILDESAQLPSPYFIFANTSENHTAYYVGKFPKNTIPVSGLPDYPAGILETYAEGSHRADEMLRTLVTHYAGRPEPTMLVWFGDHLPNLGPDYLTYKSAGYITGEDDPQFLEKMHRVPVLIWTNYQPPDAAKTFSFGTNLLGPQILKEAGLAGTPWTDYLQRLGARVPAIPARRYWESLSLPQDDLQQYDALQRDIVSGEQTIYGDLKNQIVNPGYLVGHGPITLESAGVQSGTVVIHGKHLPRTGVVYAGGRPVPTTWIGYEALRCTLPPGSFEVEVRVLDDEKAIVARSNVLTVTVPQ
ncbi:MAG TPA: sulfatase-like hydrolase/transferase [Symbiobacteriaceae bacterium]|nr:sulfatase-like hydrolase/transferase [Symbiobacteriaceae bacterium]